MKHLGPSCALLAALVMGGALAADDSMSDNAARAPEGSNFSLDWFTVDAGGGSSSGSGFNVEGTFGQPDAGDASGGGFELRGGFWPGEPSDSLFQNGFE